MLFYVTALPPSSMKDFALAFNMMIISLAAKSLTLMHTGGSAMECAKFYQALHHYPPGAGSLVNVHSNRLGFGTLSCPGIELSYCIAPLSLFDGLTTPATPSVGLLDIPMSQADASFIAPIIEKRDTMQKPSAHSPAQIRWLQGLRGLAALLVYWHHHQLWAHRNFPQMELAFGFQKRFFFSTVPIIRTFFTGGHFAVALLFVISGFALSIKPLRACRLNDSAALVDSLATSIFCRWSRLYLPLALVTLVHVTLWYVPLLGIHMKPEWADERWLPEVFLLTKALTKYSFIFDFGDPWLRYNDFLWCITPEFRGSLIVYLSILSLSRLSRRSRSLSMTCLIIYFLFFVDGYVNSQTGIHDTNAA